MEMCAYLHPSEKQLWRNINGDVMWHTSCFFLIRMFEDLIFMHSIFWFIRAYFSMHVTEWTSSLLTLVKVWDGVFLWYHQPILRLENPKSHGIYSAGDWLRKFNEGSKTSKSACKRLPLRWMWMWADITPGNVDILGDGQNKIKQCILINVPKKKIIICTN